MKEIILGKIKKNWGLNGGLVLLTNFTAIQIEQINEFYVRLKDKKKLKIKLEKINEINSKKVIYFENYKNIDSINIFFNKTIYFDGKNDLYESELINYDLLFKTKKIGKVKYIFDQKVYSSLCFEYNNEKINIPLVDKFILSIDEINKVIHLKNVEFLLENEE